MFSAKRALLQNIKSAPLLPQVPELEPLWRWGLRPRQGNLIMIAGRPGSQKSGFALFWARRLNLPTLYFSADMTPFEASTRLASMNLGLSTEMVEGMPVERVADALASSNIHFAFESPITWPNIEDELEAYVEVYNEYPKVLIIDNLMDVEGGEADYTAQMQIMQDLVGLNREIGSTTFVLHHTTDGSYVPPNMPQPRREIKNKLGEKPQITLTVALDPTPIAPETHLFRVGGVKQRSGRQDPNADEPIVLRAKPGITSFSPS